MKMPLCLKCGKPVTYFDGILCVPCATPERKRMTRLEKIDLALTVFFGLAAAAFVVAAYHAWSTK